MKTESSLSTKPPIKLIAGICALLCIALGLVGLVLPILPGLLFLAIAAVIMARNFPSMDLWMRKNRTLNRHLDGADGFLSLSTPQKLRYCGWFCLKVVLDTIALAGSLATSLVQPSADRHSNYR